MSAHLLPALSAAGSYVLAGTPTVITGCIALVIHEIIQARITYCRSSEMKGPIEHSYLIHIGGTGDIGPTPDVSFSFACLKRLILKPMGFPDKNICSLSQNSEDENRPNKSFYSLSTKEYFTIVKSRAMDFLSKATCDKSDSEKIDLIITGLSQGGAIAAQLAAELLQDPKLKAKINRLLLIPVHATIKGSTANFWPQWMRDYLIRFFYPFPVLIEFHRDSVFLNKNRDAMKYIKANTDKIMMKSVHDGVDPFVLPVHGHAKDYSARWDQILTIALPMLAVSLMLDAPLAGPLFLMAILMGLLNHAVGVNTPKISEHINQFIRHSK